MSPCLCHDCPMNASTIRLFYHHNIRKVVPLLIESFYCNAIMCNHGPIIHYSRIILLFETQTLLISSQGVRNIALLFQEKTIIGVNSHQSFSPLAKDIR